MKTVQYDITPDTHIVEGIRNTQITYAEALSELIDNSLDSGATRVEIRPPVNDNCLVVADNGNGCENLEAMLKLGKHHKTFTTALGRYGVGLKNAAIGIGDLLTIESVSSGVRRTVAIDWSSLRDWREISGTEEDSNEPNGTVITISQIVKAWRYHEETMRKLSFTFAPAIRNGKTISVSGKKIKGWQIPDMSDPVDAEYYNDELNVGYKVVAGFVNRNDEGPFIICYKHRTLCAISEPCKDYNVTSRFMAVVELFGQWPMHKHKDGLTAGPESQWLYDSLYDDCEELLKAVHKDGESVEVEQMSAILDMAIAPVKGKAKRPNRSGVPKGVDQAFTDRIVREAEIVANAGNVSKRTSSGPRGGFSTAYDNLPPGIVGKVDRNNSRVIIRLNENHEIIRHFRLTDNRVGTLVVASMLLTADTCIDGTQQQFFKIEAETRKDEFSKLTSAILENIALAFCQPVTTAKAAK